jgi:hypothetical protein
MMPESNKERGVALAERAVTEILQAVEGLHVASLDLADAGIAYNSARMPLDSICALQWAGNLAEVIARLQDDAGKIMSNAETARQTQGA